MKKLSHLTTATASALVLAASHTLFAQDNVATTTPPDPEQTQPNNFFTQTLPNAVAKGKLVLDVRMRYELADEHKRPTTGVNPKTSHAPTVRTRLGYETADIYGFKGLLEMEDVTIIGNEDNYNQAGLNSNASSKTVVADPEGTEVNQAWISYSNWDTVAKIGRQRITLDNHRFIGNVGWRQNEQTYDALSIKNTSIKDTTLFYSYLENVNRIFGDDHPQGDFDSNSHIFNASYAGLPVKITGYAYLLDLETVGLKPSSDTYGVSLSGSHKVAEKTTVNYLAEFAYQQDAGNNPANYETEYYHLAGGAAYDRFNAGVGYEVLASDNGTGFATPLATLHAFNGWADTFLNTPGNGLRDLYFSAGVNLPANIPLKVIYHLFDSETGNVDYGSEIDAVISKKFGKNWTLLAKYAYYDGDGGFATNQKFWAQAEFTF